MKSTPIDCDFRSYADDTCILSSNRNFSSIQEHLNIGFNSLCKWLIDDKLSIHLRKDKTKCNLFKKGNKLHPALNTSQK